MTYGKSMQEWESNYEERREQKWRNELENAISACNKARTIELMQSGLLNAYSFPNFYPNSWEEKMLKKLKEAGY